MSKIDEQELIRRLRAMRPDSHRPLNVQAAIAAHVIRNPDASTREIGDHLKLSPNPSYSGRMQTYRNWLKSLERARVIHAIEVERYVPKVVFVDGGIPVHTGCGTKVKGKALVWQIHPELVLEK